MPWITAWSSVQNCTQESTVVYIGGMPHLLTYMAKTVRPKMFLKIRQFSSIVIGNKIWVFYFEPARNKIWQTKHGERSEVAIAF